LTLSPDQRAARLYDVSVPDWPGEVDFYLGLAADAGAAGILEVGCGTGRVAHRLAQNGYNITGLDISDAMLEIARRKTSGMNNPRWVQADMASFQLGEQFGLCIIPGHSFQFMLTPEDQLSCLASIGDHLLPAGRLVVHLDHQDTSWLAEVAGAKSGVFEPAGEVTDPETGRNVRVARAWSYEPHTQTASVLTRREELNEAGEIIDEWETGPTPLHCVFRFEMAHLLVRAGFRVEALYGDFNGGMLTDRSSEMVWVATRSD
jgi:SAM-dependent methyltransferase